MLFFLKKVKKDMREREISNPAEEGCLTFSKKRALPCPNLIFA